MNKEPALEKFKPYILAGICILTFLCFRGALNNQFTNWDDDVYIKTDPYIKAFTGDNLKVIFTKNITLNYYHPLTMLSLAVNYALAGMSPSSYYLTNVLFHIANVLLAFFFTGSLFSKLSFVDKKQGLLASYISALWFGIHPMHVESVCWIAERKDVLYTFFYLLGLLSYLNYFFNKKIKWYGATMLFFIASCLSKPMAVVFPLSLFCIDFLLKQKWDKKLVLNKIPFLLLALGLGILNYCFTLQVNTITPFENIPVGKRVLFASYGFVMYILKFFVPVNLSTFYPYPCVNMELHIDMPLPAFYYVSLWIAILIIVVPLYFSYKINKNYFAVIAFGLAFFLVNVVFELQFISAGMAVMADRYSYVSYIGLLFISTFFITELWKRFSALRVSAIILISGITLALAYLCNKRTAVWHNAETLFTDAVEQYGDEASLFYKGLGDYYMDNGMPDKALVNYASWIRLNDDDEVLNDIGNIYKAKKDYANSARFYLRLLNSGAHVSTTYIKVSDVYANAGELDSAVYYYRKAIAIEPGVEKLYGNIATATTNAKQYQNAINHYSVLIAAQSDNPYYYFYRGVAKYSNGQIKESVDDFLMTLKLAPPTDVQASAAYNLAVAYNQLGDNALAFTCVQVAKRDGQQIDTAFFNKLERMKDIIH